jgi:hypothetical protein
VPDDESNAQSGDEESYYGEENKEEEGDEEEDLAKIKVVNLKVRDTFQVMQSSQKVQVFAVLMSYLYKYSAKLTGHSLLEKFRDSKVDEQGKFKIIAKYNEKLSKFAQTFLPELDGGLMLDLILDLLRHHSSK